MNKGVFNIVGDFSYPFYIGHETRRGDLMFYILSDELDEYYYSIEKYLSRDGGTDIMELLYSLEIEGCYSNIVNGAGIFGAQLCYKWDFEETDMAHSDDIGWIIPPYLGRGLDGYDLLSRIRNSDALSF